MLIVDDDETMCRGIQTRIRKMNFPQLHSIEIALSGEEALSYIQHHRMDILLRQHRIMRPKKYAMYPNG